MGEWSYNSKHNLGARFRWEVSFTPRPLRSRYPFCRKLSGPEIRSRRCGEGNVSAPARNQTPILRSSNLNPSQYERMNTFRISVSKWASNKATDAGPREWRYAFPNFLVKRLSVFEIWGFHGDDNHNVDESVVIGGYQTFRPPARIHGVITQKTAIATFLTCCWFFQIF
jgi:hypothetical protein